MNRLNVQESEDKHTRSIALKASKNKGKQDSSDEENLSFLSRKFSKFLKRNRNKDNNKDRYGNKKPNEFNSNNYTCFGCGEQGHIKGRLSQQKQREKDKLQGEERQDKKSLHSLG